MQVFKGYSLDHILNEILAINPSDLAGPQPRASQPHPAQAKCLPYIGDGANPLKAKNMNESRNRLGAREFRKDEGGAGSVGVRAGSVRSETGKAIEFCPYQAIVNNNNPHHGKENKPTNSFHTSRNEFKKGTIQEKKRVPLAEITKKDLNSALPTLKKSGSGSGVGLAGGLRSVLWGEPITIKEESHSGPIKDYDIPLSLYEDDVFQYLICQEQKSRVSPNYFIHQTDLTERMRKIMVDWLIKVHLTFNLMPESLYLAVQLMDRYLTSKVIHRSSYQLVGMACLLISAKMEDVAPPQIEDFLVLTENGFSRDEIVKTEFDILVTLEFECSVPTPYHFMRIYLGDLYNTDDSFEYLCNYLIESSLMEISLHNYAPSLISAGALYLARKMYLDEPAWNLKLEEITTYNEEFSKECAVNICIFLRKLIRSTTLKGLIKKYSLDEFKEVSLIPLPSDLYHH